MSDRDEVFGRVARMWERRDPMPASLVAKVLVAIETDSLDEEYELLHIVERSRELQGARGLGEALTIAFSGGPFSLLLRVSPVNDTHCRVDGWVSPPQAMTVTATQQKGSWRAVVNTMGRFELDRIPSGLTRFFLVAGEGEPVDHSFATPTVEL